MTRLELRNREGIAALEEVLHDWWMDLDAVVFDQSEGILRMPFVKSALGRKPGHTDAELVVVGVAAWEVRNTERVRWYDLNEIVVEDDRLRFTFATPLEILVSVNWHVGTPRKDTH